jgi:hypothetical protein
MRFAISLPDIKDATCGRRPRGSLEVLRRKGSKGLNSMDTLSESDPIPFNRLTDAALTPRQRGVACARRVAIRGEQALVATFSLNPVVIGALCGPRSGAHTGARDRCQRRGRHGSASLCGASDHWLARHQRAAQHSIRRIPVASAQATQRRALSTRATPASPVPNQYVLSKET